MKAWELLDSPEKWTQGHGALDSAGLPLFNASSSDAVCWCMEGAIEKAYSNSDWINPKLKAAKKVSGIDVNKIGMILIHWNDAPERTWEEVHALLKELDI